MCAQDAAEGLDIDIWINSHTLFLGAIQYNWTTAQNFMDSIRLSAADQRVICVNCCMAVLVAIRPQECNWDLNATCDNNNNVHGFVWAVWRSGEVEANKRNFFKFCLIYLIIFQASCLSKCRSKWSKYLKAQNMTCRVRRQ